MIAARYRVDPDDRALLGHSAAGHFVLQALFRRPEGFTRYAAISPALAYNDGEAFELEAQYARTHTDLPVSLYLGVGSEEARALAYVNVVSNTARMIEQLDVRNYPGLKLSTGFLSGKTHISVFPEALNQVLERFWPA
jgi:predicted alpha/beta superfamily hydrolase